MFSLLFLHLFLYGCNILLWMKTRINYSFIFEFAPTKELKYRDVFLMCTTGMSIVVGVMFVHLTLFAKGHSSSQIRAIPGLLLLVCTSNISNTIAKEEQLMNFDYLVSFASFSWCCLCALSTFSTVQLGTSSS